MTHHLNAITDTEARSSDNIPHITAQNGRTHHNSNSPSHLPFTPLPLARKNEPDGAKKEGMGINESRRVQRSPWGRWRERATEAADTAELQR